MIIIRLIVTRSHFGRIAGFSKRNTGSVRSFIPGLYSKLAVLLGPIIDKFSHNDPVAVVFELLDQSLQQVCFSSKLLHPAIRYHRNSGLSWSDTICNCSRSSFVSLRYAVWFNSPRTLMDA
jgi:hypothetical protein